MREAESIRKTTSRARPTLTARARVLGTIAHLWRSGVYILDLKFTREELKAFNPESNSMHPFLVHSGARFQMTADYQLGRIEPPFWLNHEDIQIAPVE